MAAWLRRSVPNRDLGWCAVADGMKHSANINQDMRLEFRACLEDLTDDNRCDIEPVNLTFAK